MSEQYPESKEQRSRLLRLKAAGRRAGALVGVTAFSMLGTASIANAKNSEFSSVSAQSAQMVSGGPNDFLEKVSISNKEEETLLQEIRLHKHSAFLVNGAIEFHMPTTDYLGPTDKADLVAFHTSPGGQELVLYYPLITKLGNTVYVATLDTNHQVANVGQGSYGPDIGWIPLDGTTGYTIWQNTADKEPSLMKFEEAYDAHPMGLNAPTEPVYNILPEGDSKQLPNFDGIMDTEAWPHSESVANLKSAGYTALSLQEVESLIANLHNL